MNHGPHKATVAQVVAVEGAETGLDRSIFLQPTLLKT